MMWQLVIPAITQVLDKIIPDPQAAADAKLKALELAQKGDLAALDAELRLALGQIEVNKAEATTDIFRGGWRPAVGWVCVVGLAYQFILQPVLPWVVALFGAQVPPLPAIDNESLMVLLTGMLGLGGLRTFERVKGKA
ncbi:MAG: 3TM-type holin [Gammaproteobacteria bacterium]